MWPRCFLPSSLEGYDWAGIWWGWQTITQGFICVHRHHSSWRHSWLHNTFFLWCILLYPNDSLHILLEKLSYLHAPSFSSLLHSFARLQRGLVSETVNFDLSDCVWTCASLPVHSEGHGFRSAVLLAPSAFLASAATCSDLSYQILLERLSGLQCTFQDLALDMWSQSYEASSPEGIESFLQISWITPLVQTAYNQLLSDAQAEASLAHLLAAAWKESGAWINAVPVTSLDLRMGD